MYGDNKVWITYLGYSIYVESSGGATLYERGAFAPNNFLNLHVNYWIN